MTIKISQLPNVAAYSDSILIPIVDSSTGTPTTTKATGGALKSYILGNITQDVANVNANIIAANIGMTGYVTAVSSAANVGMKGYVDLQFVTANTAINNSNTGMKGYVDSLTFGGLGAVTTANIGMKGYVDQGNSTTRAYIDGQIIASNVATTVANTGMKGYVDAVTTSWTANAYQQQAQISNLQSTTTGLINSAYSNVNVQAYLNSGTITGNIITQDFQAKGFSNVNYIIADNTVSRLGFFITSTIGNLTIINGNIVMAPQLPGFGYLFGNLQYANGLVLNSSIVNIENNIIAANTATTWANSRMKLYVDGQITSANAGVTAANVGMKGYVDFANTVQAGAILAANVGMTGYVGASVSSANTAMKGYVDSAITTITGGAPALLDTLGELANAIGTDPNLSVTLTNKISNAEGNIIAANTGMRGYVDNSTLTANTGMKGYVDGQISTTTTAITTANTGMRGYVDAVTTAWTANAYQQQAQIGNLQASIAGASNYSNANVASYLPTYSGVLTASNVAVNGNVTAQYLYGNGAFLTGVVTGGSGGTNYSNANVAGYLPTYAGVVTASNVTVNGNVTAVKFFGDGSSLTGVVAAATAANIAVQDEGVQLTPTLATINFVGAGVTATFANSVVTATIAGYSNVNAATYLVGYGGAIQSSNVQTTTANIQGNTATTSLTTGALRVAGGAAVRGGLMIGGLRFVQPSYITVSNTAIYALSTTTSDNILVVAGGGFTANLTIPPSPTDGQVFTLSVVTNSVILQKNGAATLAPDFSGTTANVGARYRYIYRNADGTWYAAG